MKVNCWDKCFLCLTNVKSESTSSSSSCGEKRSRGRHKQLKISETPNFSVLVKYLLGSCDQNDSLLQRIQQLQLQRPKSTSSAEGLIQFCDKCQDSARRLSHLQKELEVIQMKIVDILCSMRKTVINNSTLYRFGIGNNNENDGSSKTTLEEFTAEGGDVLDTLYAFQAAVFEKGKESVHVPLVYIEKFTGFKNLTKNRATPTTTPKKDEFLIKTEPEADSLDLEETFSEFGDDYDYAAATPHFEFNEGFEVEEEGEGEPPLSEIGYMPPPRKLQKRSINSNKTKISKTKKEKSPGKRGRPRKNLPTVESPDTTGLTCQAFNDDPRSHKLKEEETELLPLTSEQDANVNPIIKEEKSDGIKRARSAAQTAVKRIANVKKLSRASFQYRPRKVATKKARKNKEAETKSKSTPAMSSYPQHPNKILLTAVLKTGKPIKTPKKGGTKSIPNPKRIRRFFQCELCSYKKTRINYQFEHHLREHESPEVVSHTCPHCTNPVRQFSQRQSFEFHMNCHAGQNKMGCDICSKFIDAFAILEHLRGHPEVEKIFQCSCCSYCCGTREGYLKHTRHHRTAALVCDVCSKKCRSRQKLFEHMHNEHQLLEKIKCDVENCDKEFFETFTLDVHKRLHTEAFVCFECNLQFPTTRGLRDHQVRKHSRDKPHSCPNCPEAFIDKPSLLSHQIKAHGAAKLKCPYCPKEYASPGILSSHINLHEGISFPCDKCDKVFGDRGQLKRHQVVHKTTKDFICEECGKAFGCAPSLARHMKIHIGDKKYKCSYCPKAFVNRKNLICHERIHTGEKPYVCEACGKAFNQQSALIQHTKLHHKELIGNKNKSQEAVTGPTPTSTEDELN